MSETTTELPKVLIMAWGLCEISVCAANDATKEEIERHANRENPTGISSRWEISDDETFSGGEPNPCPCQDHPEERKHWLLDC